LPESREITQRERPLGGIAPVAESSPGKGSPIDGA